MQPSVGCAFLCGPQMAARLALPCSTPAPQSTPSGGVLRCATSTDNPEVESYALICSILCVHQMVLMRRSTLDGFEWYTSYSHERALFNLCLMLSAVLRGWWGQVSFVCCSAIFSLFSSSLLPGLMYTVDVLTQSGVGPDEFPSTSHSAGPLRFWTSKSHVIIQ